MSHDAAAQLLQVTPRTIKYWVSGAVRVPYAAYKLIRIMRGFELPCEGWDGWHMHSGKLWSPEGHGFTPECQGWWHLLVRQAAMFRQMAVRGRQLDIAMHRTLHGPVGLAPGSGGPETSEAARGPHLAPVAPKGLELALTPPSSNTGGKVPLRGMS